MNGMEETMWDVIVIGGGPAGMMAAGRAAERGKRVLLLEKNDTLGKKLLITGGGRCNLTNNEPDTRKFLSKYKDSDKFLFSAFSQFAVTDTFEFFNARGMETKVEALGRVFPLSNTSRSVWETLLADMKKHRVTVLSDSPAAGFDVENGTVVSVRLKSGKHITAKSFILATGGKSHPETGSTGDGFAWLKELGHTVVEPTASLVPVVIEDAWVKRLQGVTLPEAKMTVLQNEVKQDMRKGKILFTHFGISGPTVLNASSEIGELLKYGDVIISLDLLPQYDHGQLNAQLQEIFKLNSNKKLKNALSDLIPSPLVPIVIELSNVDGETFSHSITRENRLALIEAIKGMRMKASGLLGEDKAIITSGGIALEEVDFKTMASKKYPNLFLVGDILNIDRPSGGYSLQLCWTTGFVAGAHAGND